MPPKAAKKEEAPVSLGPQKKEDEQVRQAWRCYDWIFDLHMLAGVAAACY